MGFFDSFKKTETPSLYGSMLYRDKQRRKDADQIIMDYRKRIDQFDSERRKRSEDLQKAFSGAAKRQYEADIQRNAQAEFLQNLQEQELSRRIGTQRVKEARRQAFMRGIQGAGFQNELQSLGEFDAAQGIVNTDIARRLADQTATSNYGDMLLRNLGEGLQVSMADANLSAQRAAMQNQMDQAAADRQQRQYMQYGQALGTIGGAAYQGWQGNRQNQQNVNMNSGGYTGSDMTYTGQTNNLGGASYGTQSMA